MHARGEVGADLKGWEQEEWSRPTKKNKLPVVHISLLHRTTDGSEMPVGLSTDICPLNLENWAVAVKAARKGSLCEAHSPNRGW